MPNLLIELFYIGMPVVRTDGLSGGRCTVTWLPNFLGWVDNFIFSPMVLRWRPSRARAPLKFILGFETWENKTKEVYYLLLTLKIDFFCFIPQVSQPSINPAINTQLLSRTTTNKTKHVTSKLRSVFLYKAKSPCPMKVNEDLESQPPLKPKARKCIRITTFNRNYILCWIKWNHQKLKICTIRGSLRSIPGWVG